MFSVGPPFLGVTVGLKQPFGDRFPSQWTDWRLPEDRPFLIGSVIQHNGTEYSSLSPIKAYMLDPKAKGRGSWKVNPD